MVHHLIFPEECTIHRHKTSTTVDPVYHQPTSNVTATVVYTGKCRISGDEFFIARITQGSDIDADCFLYLPPGDHGIKIDDRVEWRDLEGRVVSIVDYTRSYYTRLMVKWDAA